MEYTEEQKRGFIRDFANLKRRQLFATIPFIVIVFGSLVFADQDSGALLGIPPAGWIPVVAIMLIGVVVFSLKNWRCPACEKYLGKGFNPRFCPKCGVQLKA